MNTRARAGGAMVSWVSMVMTVLLFQKGVEATTTTVASTSPSSSSVASSVSIDTRTCQATSSLPRASASSTSTNPTTASSSALSSSSIAASGSVSPSLSSRVASTVSTVEATTTTVASTSPSSSSVASTVSTVEATTTTVASTSPSSSSVASSVSIATSSLPRASASSTSTNPTTASSSALSSSSIAASGSVSPSLSSRVASTVSTVEATTTTVASTSPSSSSVASSVSIAASSMGSSSSTPTIPPSSPSSASATTRPLPMPSTSKPGASSSIAALTPKVPAKQNDAVKPFFVLMNFSMPWGRFCRFTSVFRELMSRKLPVVKGSGMHMSWEFTQKERIKVIYEKEKCLNSSYYDEKAMIRFYVSNSVKDWGQNDTDDEMTKESFAILHYYWKNDRMVLLDEVYEGKVTNVQFCEGFMEKDYTCKHDDGLTESQHIGIAIGIALAIVVLILIIIHCSHKGRARSGAKRRHDDGRLIITNSIALEEVTAKESLNLSQPPGSQPPSTAELDEVAVHRQPSKPETSEDGKKGGETKSDGKPSKEEAPLAKPEPDNVSVEEPIKSADETEVNAAPAKPEKDATGTPDISNDEDTGSPDKSEDEGIGEQRPTFTSSVTIMLTPDATSPPTKFEYSTEDDAKAAPANAADERPKLDFSQSDDSDVDPNKSAINLGFDGKDEADQKENGEEETQF